MNRARTSPVGRARPDTHAEIPSVIDLLIDPELAPLVLLEAASHVLIQALIAANPEMLHCAERPATALEPVTVAAYSVVAACRHLDDALAVYRARVCDCRMCAERDDIPF